MKEINQKEDWRNYNTSREFSKDIKFNKKWYHLTALFDKDQDGEEFDFNADPEPQEFDFNKDIDLAPIYEPDQYLNSIEFDFNSVLMEKYKITEIGLIMSELNEGTQIDQTKKQYNISKIIKDKKFINFYNAVNAHEFKGFYIKTALEVFDKDSDDVIASINDNSNFKTPDISKSILSTLLKNAGGHANEATIQLLSDLKDDKAPADYSKQNIIQLLSNLEVCNNSNPMAFPDTIFKVSKNNIIPIDLKVAYNNRFSGASGRNIRFMSGIYNALLNAIDKKETLIDYIKNSNVSGLTNNEIMLELKGFLLISSTTYNRDNKRLDYSGICIKPLIACVHGRNNIKNDPLFASKDGHGQGAISYDNGDDKEFNEPNSILNGCPIRFANVIKNFYNCLINGIEIPQYGNLLMFLDDKIKNSEDFKSNLNIIYKAIDPAWEFDFNKENLTEK